MNKKYSCIILLLFVFFLTNHLKADNYTICGKNLDALNGKEFFLLIETSGTGIEQEIGRFTIENGMFSVSGEIENPLLLTIKDKYSEDVKSIFLEGTAYMFTGTDGTLANTALETNSVYNKQFYTVMAFESNIESLKLPLLEQYYSLTEAETETMDSLVLEVDKLNEKILAHRINRIVTDGNEDVLKEGLSKFDASLKTSPYVVSMQSKADALSRVAVGQIAPDFSIQDLDGNTVKLSDYRGKYVLLDFWASWCVPCRKEFPHLLDVYKKQAGDKFDILGVSLDDNRADFVTALKEENLPWKNVSELKRSHQEITAMYVISFIPKNFLIDPDGKILAIDLRGDEGMAELNAILSGSVQK